MTSQDSPVDRQASARPSDVDSTPSPDTSGQSSPRSGSFHLVANPYASVPCLPSAVSLLSQHPQSAFEVMRATSSSSPLTSGLIGLRQSHVIPGLQPMSSSPLPPQISAAELSLLTEASATNNGTFQCSHCNKQFGYKNGLIRHVRLTHVGEKPYQCNICSRRFGYKHILKEHQNLHFGNRPYACTMCDKRFAARSNLIQHRMVHKRPYNCGLCSKRFDREDQLKKHLFAHPQSLLMCTYCAYTGSSQADINRHLMEDHPCNPDDPVRNMLWKREMEFVQSEERYPGIEEFQNEGRGAGDQSQARDFRTYRQELPAVNRGRKIDAICTQLTCNASIGEYQAMFQQQQQQQQMLLPHPEQTHSNRTSYSDVVIKQELPDEPEMNDMEIPNKEIPNMEIPNSHSSRTPHRCHQRSEDRRSSSRPLDLKTNHFMPKYFPMVDQRFTWSPHLPRYPLSMSALATIGSSGYPDERGCTSSESARGSGHPSTREKSQPSSALPGIHEVFSRQQKQQQTLPSFSNFIPVQMTSAGNVPELSLFNGQQPSMLAAASTMNAPPTAPSTGAAVSRPTAQLPPIAHQTVRQTKDQAVQHSLTIAGFPSLDDVLAYYVSQGRLFKCQHCNTLFFERGMYFLHASLHGLSSPWECSICHKVCSDKNEFTLHFVNQQHCP